MRRSFRHALLAAAALVCASAAIAVETGELSPFGRGSFAEIRKAHAGKPLVVHFWSVTCPACIAELGEWAKLARERQNVDIVFVNTDSDKERTRATRRLQTAGLQQAANFSFADPFVERLYFEVDNGWRGELPFTALIGPQGDKVTVIGALSEPEIAAWFEARGKAEK